MILLVPSFLLFLLLLLFLLFFDNLTLYTMIWKPKGFVQDVCPNFNGLVVYNNNGIWYKEIHYSDIIMCIYNELRKLQQCSCNDLGCFILYIIVIALSIFPIFLIFLFPIFLIFLFVNLIFSITKVLNIVNNLYFELFPSNTPIIPQVDNVNWIWGP